MVLATLATVIASQAVISGAFSMTQQAIQLGFLPRMQVVVHLGQRGGPDLPAAVNWILLVAVILAAIGFGSSSRAGLGLRHRRDGDDADHDAC